VIMLAVPRSEDRTLMRSDDASDADLHRVLSRRGVLRLGLSTALLGLTASCARLERGRRREAATPTLNSPPTPTSASATAAAPTSPIASARFPSPAPPPGSPPPPWFTAAPVRSLPEYVARTAGTPPFPSNAVMLTIDDGPHPVWTPRILRLLHKYDVRATFCVVGLHATAHPDLVRAAVSEGHHLANHTYSHPARLQAMPEPSIDTQIADAQDAIVRASGYTPHQFRSPGGRWSPALMHASAAHNLTAIDWNIDPRDWSRPGTAHIIQALLAARPGDILLCHDGGGDRSQTYAALAIVLPQLKARGLQFVTLPTPHH
jgi:peptidoglycan/xylan/chitin deacetylase (PgdA/CDA1 family)